MSRDVAVAVYFDLICPWCLIGKRNLEAAIGMLAQSDPSVSVRIDWRSSQLLPDIPAEGVDFMAFYEARLGGPAAVRARQAQVLEAAQAAGCRIEFGKIRRMPNTARAHRLLQLARRRPSAFDALLEALFRAHFVEGLDIGDPGALAELAEACGAVSGDQDLRLDDAGRDAEWAHAAPSVPLYVFADGAAVAGAHPPQILHRLLAEAATAAHPRLQGVHS